MQDYSFLADLAKGLPLDPLPAPLLQRDPRVPHAPRRVPNLSPRQKRQTIQNALRYFPEHLHQTLGVQFLGQLQQYGHIYMYRFLPKYPMRAYGQHLYPAVRPEARALIHNIMNNLDPQVAQFPHELVTYGGNGSVFQNWAQYHLVMHYLCRMEEGQTLVLNSGHPQGLYPAPPNAPLVTICNGLMVPNFSTIELYQKLYAMGCTQYGQMTAGSFCYIGSQGIVHGTTLTLQNAARKYLGREDMTGLVYVSSGLGGMSGAQPKAGDICRCISVIAEVSQAALEKRLKQGWIKQKVTDLDYLVTRLRQARKQKQQTSIGFLGNIVDLWERLAAEQQLLVDLGSDQTSLHNPFGGGYYPAGLSYEKANECLSREPQRFKQLVRESLVRQVAAINKLAKRGMRFWDYGNSFLLEASKAKAQVVKPDGDFIYPSYVEDIMGDIFELGFGPFRWICTSGLSEDLRTTDECARRVLLQIYEHQPETVKRQLDDNIRWIERAEQAKLVVGSQARILYADHVGRSKIAEAFSDLVREKKVGGPIVLSRDHHDVSGVDSPFRETASVRDGSKFTADMAVQNFVGDAVRGATWVALHNGGGCGWGNVMNGGFGFVLTGSEGEKARVRQMLFWDVANGVTRRAWAGGKTAKGNLVRLQQWSEKVCLTKAVECKEELLNKVFKFSKTAQQ